MGSISHLTIGKFNVQTHIYNVFKRDNIKSVLLWLVERNNVIDYIPQYFMAFTKYSTRHGHWSNDCSTSHPRSFFNQKEHFNLAIACTPSLGICNGKVVSYLETLLYICEWKMASPNCSRLKKVTHSMDSTPRCSRRSSSNGAPGVPFFNAPTAKNSFLRCILLVLKDMKNNHTNYDPKRS